MGNSYLGTLTKKEARSGAKGEFYQLTIDGELFFANKSVSEIPDVGEAVKVEYDITGQDNRNRPYRWIKSVKKMDVKETSLTTEPEEEAEYQKKLDREVRSYQSVVEQAIGNAFGIVSNSLMFKKCVDKTWEDWSILTDEQKQKLPYDAYFANYVEAVRSVAISLAIQYERSR